MDIIKIRVMSNVQIAGSITLTVRILNLDITSFFDPARFQLLFTVSAIFRSPFDYRLDIVDISFYYPLQLQLQHQVKLNQQYLKDESHGFFKSATNHSFPLKPVKIHMANRKNILQDRLKITSKFDMITWSIFLLNSVRYPKKIR